MIIVPNVAYAATGKVTTINTTNLYNAYNSTKKTWYQKCLTLHLFQREKEMQGFALATESMPV